ncbi:unnamed protein product [Musa banksii]
MNHRPVQIRKRFNDLYSSPPGPHRLRDLLQGLTCLVRCVAGRRLAARGGSMNPVNFLLRTAPAVGSMSEQSPCVKEWVLNERRRDGGKDRLAEGGTLSS